MKKKLLAVLLCICTTATLLGGCGSSNDERNNITSTEVETSTEVISTETEVVEGTEVLVLHSILRETEYNTYETIYEYDNKGRTIKTTIKEKQGEYSDTTETVYAYDDNDNVISELKYDDGELEHSIERTYDENGNIVATKSWDGLNKKTYYVESKYDTTGKILERKTQMEPDAGIDYIQSEVKYTQYEYDSNGNLIKEINLNEDKTEVTVLNEYAYDENSNLLKHWSGPSVSDIELENLEVEYIYENNILKEEHLFHYQAVDDGYTFMTDKNIYDENGNLISATSYRPDGSIYSVKEYDYDANGKLLKEVADYGEGAYDVDGWITYQYDENDNLIKKECYGYIDYDYYQIFEYTYDENGNKIEEKGYNNDSDINTIELSYCYKFEYDAYGNKTRGYSNYTGADDDWRISDYVDYEYDEYGNVTKTITYAARENYKEENGEWISEIVYEPNETITKTYINIIVTE